MNPIHTLIGLMAVLLALINSPLRGQEKPAPNSAEETPLAEAPEPETAKEEPAKPRISRPRSGATPAEKATPGEKPTPFIGVLTTHVSPELRAQLGLPEGFGLQVVEVMPDSPAKDAGLKEHDILVNFGDQKLVTMEQLQALVRSREKNDEITLTVITGGQTKEIPLKIGERMMPDRPEESRRQMGRFFPPHQRQEQPPLSHNMRESLDRFQARLREYQERLQQWAREGQRGPMPTPPVLETPPQRDGDRGASPQRHEEERHDTSRHRSAGVTRRDDSGTYSLQRDGDRSTFSVRPSGGGEQTWTFSNDTQRQMIPEPLREKLRMLEEVAEEMRRDGAARPSGPRGGRPAPGASPSEERPPEGKPAPSRRGDTF